MIVRDNRPSSCQELSDGLAGIGVREPSSENLRLNREIEDLHARVKLLERENECLRTNSPQPPPDLDDDPAQPPVSAECLLNALIDAVQDGVTILDRGMNIVRVNAWMAENFADQKPFIGRKCYQVFGEENHPCRNCPSMRAMATGLPAVELVSCHTETSKGWLEITSHPYWDETGAIAGAVEYRRDVTERKLTEEQRETYERKLSNAMNIARLGYWELDLPSNLFTFDDHFYALFRTTAQEMGGYAMSPDEYARRFMFPEDVPLIRREIEAALTTNDPNYSRQLEHRIRYADGQTGHIAVRFFIVKDENGRTVKTYGANQDITERKKHEEELRVAKRRAETASRAKSEFLANMSHEIRTPMTAILGFTDLLLEPEHVNNASPFQIEAVRTIKRNGEHLIELINGILDLSKIEAGKFAVERIPCSPSRIAAEVVELLRVRADAAGVKLLLEHDGPLPERILTDALRLRQILINIVGNALKFTHQGAVTLVLRLSADMKNMEFDVADTGVGLTPEQAASIFTPFTQVDASSTRRFGGTGLGLTISRRLAQLLGGDVAVVESRHEQGSCFRISVTVGPLDGVAMLDSPWYKNKLATPDKTRPAENEARPLADLNILLAEDGPDNQRLIKHILQKYGARVEIADNGQIAFDKAMLACRDHAPFDVILMDMQMPVMDGYDSVDLLRTNGYPGLIIALTANAMIHDQQKCLDAGCDAYASKPVQRRILIQTILDGLNSRAQSDALS